MVREAGRNPDAFELIVRGNLEITASPIAENRASFTGTMEQIAEDIHASSKLGAAELVIDVQFSGDTRTEADVLKRMEEIKRIS